MNIAIICMIPLSFVLGFFCALKSVQLGLKWKVQVENKEIPKMDNPIAEVRKANEEIKVAREEIEQQKFTAKQISEYLYGVGGE